MFIQAALCVHISRLNDTEEGIKNFLLNSHTLLRSAFITLTPQLQ